MDKNQDALTELAQEKVQAAIVDALPDEFVLKLDKLVESDASDEEIEQLLEEAGVDYDKIAQQVAEELKEDNNE